MQVSCRARESDSGWDIVFTTGVRPPAQLKNQGCFYVRHQRTPSSPPLASACTPMMRHYSPQRSMSAPPAIL